MTTTRRIAVTLLATVAVLAPTGAAQARPVQPSPDVVKCAPGTHLVGATCFTNGTVGSMITALHIASIKAARA